MKNIGEALKEARQKNGVSIEEAAEDLELKPSQIKALEEGAVDPFKDLNSLKTFIYDYAKYLGLDQDKLIDDFNEFIFDYTSKVPTIKVEKEKKKPEKVISPYTDKKHLRKLFPWYGYLFIIILVILFGMILILNTNKEEENVNTMVGVDYYEFSK